jgi:thioredoxin reductase (NADPH)
VRYDIAIIGSGPAGLSAAINSKIRNKNIIVFGSKDLSNKMLKAPIVNNYLGFPEATGEELKDSFQKHIDNLKINIRPERINAVYAMGDYFVLMVNEKSYEASSLILATGMEYTRPLKGEEEFLGRGVGYCATCDAPLYKGKTVTIIGHNRDAEEEANYVSELAGKLYYIPLYEGEYDLVTGIEIIKDKPTEIKGSATVEKLILKEREISTDGIFVMKESVSPGQLVPGLKIEDGHILVKRDLSTNIPGCYAAGDCTGKPYQFMKSAGEGQAAALNVVQYLNNIKSSK